MINVGTLRLAIKDLPDNTPVELMHQHFINDLQTIPFNYIQDQTRIDHNGQKKHLLFLSVFAPEGGDFEQIVSTALKNYEDVEKITLETGTGSKLEFGPNQSKFELGVQTAVPGEDGLVEAILTESVPGAASQFVVNTKDAEGKALPVYVRLHGKVEIIKAKKD